MMKSGDIECAFTDFCNGKCFMNRYNPKDNPLWRKSHDICTNCSAQSFMEYLHELAGEGGE